MIIVFGSMVIDMHFDVENFSNDGRPNFATNRGAYPGGKGVKQAVAAARSGASVKIIGKVGNDDFAPSLLKKLESEEIDIEDIRQTSENHTGIIIHTKNKEGEIRSLYSPGANLETSADQVPEKLLNDKTFVLTQTEINPEENIRLLSRAKERGATTVMNLSPSLDLSQAILDHLDYLIVNQDEARQIAKKLNIQVEDNAMKLAKGLAKQGDLTCIVTVGSLGSVAYTNDDKCWKVKALAIEEIDRTGAQDAYCGTLTACLRAGMPLPRAMKRASISASITCTKIGDINTIPNQEDISERINDLDDPEEIE